MAETKKPKTEDQRPATLLYYITDRSAFPGTESDRRRRLLEKITEAAHAGVDYIQLREKDLSTRELEALAREAVSILEQLKTENRELRTALLINSRTDVALAVGADGVHLRSDDISPDDARKIWPKAHVGTAAGTLAHENQPQVPLIGVSCHSPGEVLKAANSGATFAVFAPVFEKKGAHSAKPTGLAVLHEACRARIPVLALGGVTLSNAQTCLDAGASGIAAIRLFQESHVAEVVAVLRIVRQ